jgi:hypothetical protein
MSSDLCSVLAALAVAPFGALLLGTLQLLKLLAMSLKSRLLEKLPGRLWLVAARESRHLNFGLVQVHNELLTTMAGYSLSLLLIKLGGQCPFKLNGQRMNMVTLPRGRALVRGTIRGSHKP